MRRRYMIHAEHIHAKLYHNISQGLHLNLDFKDFPYCPTIEMVISKAGIIGLEEKD